MKTKIIYVNSLNDMVNLYNVIQNTQSDVMITKGSYSIDAKSMEDMFNLNLKNGAIITYNEDEKALDEFLDTFIDF